MKTMLAHAVSRFGLVALFLASLALGAAQAGTPVFLIQTGTDAEGNPLFRVATSSDSSVASVKILADQSQAVSKVCDYFTSVQTQKQYDALSAEGLSAQDMTTAAQAFTPDPIFVEVNSNTSGSYNDWASHFTVDWGNGKVQSYSAPRVVFPLNNAVTRSGDNALIEQTLVHEIGHGVMAEAYGAANLPQTPLLGKQHSGGSDSDPQLALIEGWAEFVGAYFTGRLTIAEDPAGSMSSDAYAKNTDGSYKKLSDLVQTEGFVATLVYDIVNHDTSGTALADITKVMEQSHPGSLQTLLSAVEQAYPNLTPDIESAVYKDTGGQAGSPTSVAQASPPPATVPGVPPVGSAPPPTGTPPGYTGYSGYSGYPPGVPPQNPPAGSGGLSSILSSLGFVQGHTGSLLSGMLPGIIGAAAGGLVGYRFGGMVGALVGAVGGYLVGQFIASNFLGGNYASQSYTSAPGFAAPTGGVGGAYNPYGIASSQGIPGVSDPQNPYGSVTYSAPPSSMVPAAGSGQAGSPMAPSATDLATAFAQYQSTFAAYESALRSGDPAGIATAQSAYQRAYATYQASKAAAAPGH